MGFYLRKGIGFGPLRLNLSKSGLGVSAGVTGARVGIGPKGAYVHGGRHGLYYRKYMGKGSSGSRRSARDKEEVEYFVNTGLTYDHSIELNRSGMPLPPEKTKNDPLANIAGAAGIALVLIGLLFGSSITALIGVLLGIYGIYAYIRFTRKMKNAEKAVEDLTEKIEQQKPFSEVLEYRKSLSLPGLLMKRVDFILFTAINEIYYRDPDYITPEEIAETEKMLRIEKEQIHKIKARGFALFLEAVMEDHMISHEEEQQLERTLNDLGVEDQYIMDERALINMMVDLRKSLEQPLKPIEVPFNLKRNETAYYKTEGRMLKSKIMNRFQENNVVYKEKGYDIDMKGDIYLTDNRIMIVGKGSRSYLLKHIMDVTLSVEDNTVQLVIDGRKTPVIYTAPDTAALTGRLEQLIER